MSSLKFKLSNTEYDAPVLDSSSVAYPRVTFRRENESVSVLAEYNTKAEADTVTLKRGGKYYTIRRESTNEDDWSLDFYVDVIETDIHLDKLDGYDALIAKIGSLPSDDDFYGANEDNKGRHLEVRYLGYKNNETYAPNGVYVPNVLDSDEDIAARKNPDGYVGYNSSLKKIEFMGGSSGIKHYRLIYHSKSFDTPE